jgi:hypothetical protein
MSEEEKENSLLSFILGPGGAAPPSEPEPQQEQKVEESLTPGIDIAAAEKPLVDDISKLELGDSVEIISDRYGPVEGRIYYRDAELIRVMPIGASNMLFDFPIDTESGKIDEDIGVTDIPKHTKRHLNTFVEQQSLARGQFVETFLPDGSPGPKFIIREVNTAIDRVVLRDIASKDEIAVPFNGKGIPRDLPFIVMRTRELPEGMAAGDDVINELGAGEAAAPDEETSTTNEEMFEEEDIDEDGFAAVDVALVGFVNVPIIEEAEEIAEIARRYPEALQKSDLLSDFISLLSARDQKDNRKLQQVRSSVEQYSMLKQAIITYDEQGQPQKVPKNTSYLTMAQLASSEIVPLQRPIVIIKKRVYAGEMKDDTPEVNDEQFVLRNAVETMASQTAFFPPDEFDEKKIKSAVAASANLEQLDKNYYVNITRYLNRFQTPYESGSTAGRETFFPKSDAEVFRLEAPATSEEDTQLLGLKIECAKTKVGTVCTPLFQKILFSPERILAPIFRPTVGGKPKQVLTLGENVPKESTVIFPPSTATTLGAKRTRRLWEDIIRSQTQHMTLKDIIDKIAIEDEADGHNILHIGSTVTNTDGSTKRMGDTYVASYVEAQPLIGMGPGDFHDDLVDLGLRETELNVPLLQVLIEKYKNTEAQIINHLAEARARAAAAPPAPQFDQMLPGTEVTSTIPRDEPLLRVLLDDLMKQSGTWSKVDLGQTCALLRRQKDLYTAVVSGVPMTIKKERDIATSRSFLQALNDAKAAKKMRTDLGEQPKENKCKHVATLRGIRRHDEPQERAVLLLQFLNQYQGERKNDWIHCMVCKEHLLCEHELVQLQMAIHPRETDTLSKKLHLEYAGGLFGAHYVCRVCGQPFSELGYDTHLEFDDEGRPMIGRAVLVDEDALRKNEIELLLGAPIKKDNAITFNNKDMDILYNIAKQICRRVGIYPDLDGYRRIVNPAYAAFKKEPQTEEDLKRRLAAEAKKKGKPVPFISYEAYIAKATLGIVGAYTLLEIQTKAPEYNPRYILSGCEAAGFGGFPLGSKEDQTGIKYISCALAGITSGEDIWEKSKFLNIKDFSDRVNKIGEYVLSNCMKMMTDTASLQRMSDKRAWVEKMIRDQQQRYPETVRTSFMPAQIYSSTDEAAKVAEQPILVENAGPIHASVDAWILKAHAIARLRSVIYQNSPYAETFCCENPLNAPTAFWTDKQMPALPGRRMSPFTSLTPFEIQDEARPIQPILADPPASIFHRLFLNVCYDGPRKGFVHETGFNNICAWCGFEFPGHPSVVDPDIEGLQALQAQGVDLSATSFEDLLDTCHKKYKVTPYKIPKLLTAEERMTEIAKMDPAPLISWKTIVTQTAASLAELPATADEFEIASKLDTLSDTAGQAQVALARILAQRTSREGSQEEYVGILTSLLKQPAEELLEIIEFYFLTATNILLNSYGVNNFQKISPKLRQEAPKATDTLLTVMEAHYDNIQEFENTFIGENTSFAREKLTYFSNQLTALLKMKEYFKPLLLPGTSQTLNYVLKLGFIAPLVTLLDPMGEVPGLAAMTASEALRNQSAKALIDFIKGQLNKYRKEGIKFSPAEIQLNIAKIAEREKDGIIQYFEKFKKDPARFEVEMMNKRLGLGRWAVGGTAAIRQYDDDHYEFEREERLKNGIIDFPGIEAAQGRQYNMFDLMEGGGGPAEEGYDNAQVAADDF